MTPQIDHPAQDIGTVTVLGQDIRVCGRCLKAVELHAPMGERMDGDDDTPME